MLETGSAVPMAVIVFVRLHQWIKGLQQVQYSYRPQQVHILEDSNGRFLRICQGKHKDSYVKVKVKSPYESCGPSGRFL